MSIAQRVLVETSQRHLAPPRAPVSLDAVRSLVRGLNREQRRAVMHGPGPLLVIAGPGTGKTEVVTRRVARLIAAKAAQPREILALTFTDNAAREMQARVDVLVPYGQADAAIHTFHAFGDRLLRDHAFELGLAGDVRLISRPEAIVLLRENAFDLGLDRYLPLADPTRFLGALVDLFGRAKDEGLTPQTLQASAERMIEELSTAGDDADPAVADVAAVRAELGRAFDAYARLLTSHGLIDHADQIGLPLRLLRERPLVRQALQAHYRFMLVDELQDANAAQVELVLALAGPTGNVMVVGDPDQGIYDFRGASSGNVARFASAYTDIRTVVLRRNYRARSPIIDASRRVIAHNRANETAIVSQVAQRRSRNAAPVRLRTFRTWDEECDAIAEQIATRVSAGERPSDFCVLVRSNAETKGALASLLVRGVPATNGARPDLLRLPAVRALLAFLRVVADRSNSLELYALASSAPYLLAGTELNGLLQAARRRSRPLWDNLSSLLAGDGPPVAAETRRRIEALLRDVDRAVELSARHTTGEVLHDYLRRSGALASLARLDEAGPDLTGMRGISRFVALVRSRASLLPLDRVSFVVAHLERLSDDETALEVDGPAPDQVQVLTVHRAKGLEFKVVFLAGLVDGRFPVRARPAVLELPAELSTRPAAETELAEERRLFYVAMTRACDELWLSFHTGAKIRRRPSPFIAEAIDAPVALPMPVLTSGPDTVAQIEQLLEPPPMPVLPVRSPVAALSLSYSQVDEYLTCPERYRLRYVVGLSTPAHHALAYGSALHQTIAAFHVSQGRGTPLTEDELLAEFDRHWTPDGFLSREHEEARYAAGRDALRRFRSRELAGTSIPIAIERPFRFRLGPDQIVGRVDRLDRGPAGAVITDYKSSDVRDQKRADGKARDSLQLQVYALAHQAETGELPARVQLHFIDSGVIGSAVPLAERLDKARHTLETAANGIRAAEFAARPSAITCGYCPFRDICPRSAA